jgi:hypothetical protein
VAKNLVTAKEVISALDDGRGCLANAHEDEPVFVIRAKDVCFQAAISRWLEVAQRHGVDGEKIAGAERILQRAQVWQSKNGTKIPD